MNNTKPSPEEIRQIVEGAQRFLAPTTDPRDNELFDPTQPETPPTKESVVEQRPMKHY